MPDTRCKLPQNERVRAKAQEKAKGCITGMLHSLFFISQVQPFLRGAESEMVLLAGHKQNYDLMLFFFGRKVDTAVYFVRGECAVGLR